MAFTGADASALLSMTVVGAYWSDCEAGRSRLQGWLERWMPLIVKGANAEIAIDIRPASLLRSSGESGRELYCRAQAALGQLVARLPAEEQYPPLSGTWEEALSG
jgi:hypothetical protein